MDMKTVVIDSLERISVRGNAGSTPELIAVSGDDPSQVSKSLATLEQMLSSLSLDNDTVNALMDIGADIMTDGGEYGFRRGFRVATRLMMESLEVPEAPKTGDSADIQSVPGDGAERQ